MQALYKERVTSDFQLFQIVGEMATIEKHMWKYSCRMASYSASSMRDRFQYLFNLNVVLRMESLYLEDLSDLCYFIFHQKQERDPYQSLVLRVGTRKANQRRTILVERCGM